jgi:hypothetical protein
MAGGSRILEDLAQHRRLLEELDPRERLIEATRSRHLDLWESLRPGLELAQQHQRALNAALGPTLGAGHFHELLSGAPWQQAAAALRSYEATLVLPRGAEIHEFAHAALRETEGLRHSIDHLGLVRSMESMHTPWLDQADQLASLSAFAELQALGHAVERLPAFERDLVSVLRNELGDWRGVSLREEVIADPLARHEFYREIGFNDALTSLPVPAFDEGADIAGLDLPVVDPVHDYGRPREEEEPETEGLELNTRAYRVLFVLETRIRAFIDEAMRSAHGDGWIKQRVPGEIHQRWRERQREARDAGAPEQPLIAYADFMDYVQVIERRDNWSDVFEPVFRRKDDVRESFARLSPIRICTMHARPISLDDDLLLRTEVRRILKAIGVL